MAQRSGSSAHPRGAGPSLHGLSVAPLSLEPPSPQRGTRHSSQLATPVAGHTETESGIPLSSQLRIQSSEASSNQTSSQTSGRTSGQTSGQSSGQSSAQSSRVSSRCVSPASETEPQQDVYPEQLRRYLEPFARRQGPSNCDEYMKVLEMFIAGLGINPQQRNQLTQQTVQPSPLAHRHINDLPTEVLTFISEFLDTKHDLLSFMLVQRRWTAIGAARLWQKPQINSQEVLSALASVLVTYDTTQCDYRKLVRRLNFTRVDRYLTNKDLAAFVYCANVDRLVLTGCNNVSPRLLSGMVAHMPRLQSVDLQGVAETDDSVLASLAAHCRDLHTFYGGGDHVTDAGLAALSALRFTLRRLILSRCPDATLHGVRDLVTRCPNLVELDLGALHCFGPNSTGSDLATSGFSNEDTRTVMMNCIGLRDLRLDGSLSLTGAGFDVPVRLDALRVLQLSMCPRINDSGIATIVRVAPRIRHINLSKCPLITDKGVCSIAEAYGPALNYLHLGHCTKITDRSVARVAERCPRLVFFDAANCVNLTNASLRSLSRLPKLRRIGVVKCHEIGSEGVMALCGDGGSTDQPFERLHLSYCTSISLQSIKKLLDSCPRLLHLSLTGVKALMRDDVRQLSRPAPAELTEQQRQMFCVFSGSGIGELRELLNRIYDQSNSLSALAAQGVLDMRELDPTQLADLTFSTLRGGEIPAAALEALVASGRRRASEQREASSSLNPSVFDRPPRTTVQRPSVFADMLGDDESHDEARDAAVHADDGQHALPHDATTELGPSEIAWYSDPNFTRATMEVVEQLTRGTGDDPIQGAMAMYYEQLRAQPRRPEIVRLDPLSALSDELLSSLGLVSADPPNGPLDGSVGPVPGSPSGPA